MDVICIKSIFLPFIFYRAHIQNGLQKYSETKQTPIWENENYTCNW